MLSALSFLCFVVVPTCVLAGLISRALESAAERAENSDLFADLTSNTADIAGRLDNLETVMMAERNANLQEVRR